MEEAIIPLYTHHSKVYFGLFPFSPLALLVTIMFIVINFANDKLFGLVCTSQ
jgi:hypothetical protein